ARRRFRHRPRHPRARVPRLRRPGAHRRRSGAARLTAVTTSDTDLGSPPAERSADPFDGGAGGAGIEEVEVLEGDDRPGPSTALWITLVIAALVLGGAIGWRVTKASDTTEQPARDSVDVGFFQDMGTHHGQAVAMGFSYVAHGTDPLLRQIATEIIDYQNAE